MTRCSLTDNACVANSTKQAPLLKANITSLLSSRTMSTTQFDENLRSEIVLTRCLCLVRHVAELDLHSYPILMQIQNNGICFVSVPNVLKSNNVLDVYNTTLSLASFYNDYGFGIISDVSINAKFF